MEQVSYPVKVDQGRGIKDLFFVTSRDIPELLTNGATLQEALLNAIHAIELIFFVYCCEQRPFPPPSAKEGQDFLVSPRLVAPLPFGPSVAVTQSPWQAL